MTEQSTALSRVGAQTLRDFARQALTAAGAAEDAAALCAEVLVHADLAGVDTHGVARLNQYADGLLRGLVSGTAAPVVTGSGAALAIDARNALGPVGLCLATDRAVAAAAEHGAAVVTMRGSNHAGAMAWYTERAARAGMLAIVLSGSTKSMVAPTGGASPFLGTNAFAYAAFAGQEAVSFDAALSVASRSRLEACLREGVKLPEGWAIAPDGSPALDPAEVIAGIDGLTGHSLLPFGGPYGAHKGYGISLLVELLCGPVAGAKWGPRVPGAGAADVGHVVICLNLGAFGDDVAVVGDRITAMCGALRSVPPTGDGQGVLLPGDRRRECAQRRAREGVPVSAVVLAELDAVAALLGLAPLPRDG